MEEKGFFQVEVSNEQVEYTTNIVEYSLIHHTVHNIWDYDPGHKEKTREFRITGSMGETVFADVYGLSRHKKSFGAVDGQDNGNDFQLVINGKKCCIDLKSMKRKNDNFYGYYVLNIPASQLFKDSSKTEYYYCISFHEENNKYKASFLGLINIEKIKNGEIGILYKKGTRRKRGDGSYFTFYEDTFEIFFSDFEKPVIPKSAKTNRGFKLIDIKTVANNISMIENNGIRIRGKYE